MNAPHPVSYRPVRIGKCHAVMERRSDGSLLVSHPEALGPYPAKLTERLVRWAREKPDQTWLAQRGPDGRWIHLSYGEGFERVRRIAAALVRRGLSTERPVLILSGND